MPSSKTSYLGDGKKIGFARVTTSINKYGPKAVIEQVDYKNTPRSVSNIGTWVTWTTLEDALIEKLDGRSTRPGLTEKEWSALAKDQARQLKERNAQNPALLWWDVSVDEEFVLGEGWLAETSDAVSKTTPSDDASVQKHTGPETTLDTQEDEPRGPE